MRLHLAARIHALLHGLFRPKDEKMVRALYSKVEDQFKQAGVLDEADHNNLIADIVQEVMQAFGVGHMDDRAVVVEQFVERLFDDEGLFLLPKVDWSQKYNIAEYWDMRDALVFQQSLVDDFQNTRHLLTQALAMVKPRRCNI